MQATLLVELLTEELPPNSLRTLSDVLATALFADLNESGFLPDDSTVTAYCTPRRLAASISKVLERSPDRAREVQGPSATAPAAAIAGFARKNGVTVDQLEQIDSPKGRIFVARVTAAGAALDAVLAGKLEEALKRLPIPKMMRWGSGDAQFVRPVHGLVMLHGSRVVKGTVFALESGDRTRGHRFMGRIDIVLKSADEYESRLLEDGMVVADFAARRALIENALNAEAKLQNAGLGAHEGLLDEVTALVEHPSVYAGAFDPVFLEVPQECLILTMRKNQKYFPLFGAEGWLLPKFLIVSNMKLDDPRHIVDGNQRVVRPRLEDARFFFNQDRKIRLEARVPQLAAVVYHAKLGSQLERVERLQLLSGKLARALGADPLLAERAAWLAKADLLTGMVGEFPELQGVMGRYYALHDGEPREVADAIDQHYRPRFAGDALPEGTIAIVIALADKLYALVGLFSVGERPTGDKDPYGLRRAALGIIRILLAIKPKIRWHEFFEWAAEYFPKSDKSAAGIGDCLLFVQERLRNFLAEQGHPVNRVDAALGGDPWRLDLIESRLDGVLSFEKLPEASSLATAHKRIANILKKERGDLPVRPDLLLEPAESLLFHAYRNIQPRYDEMIEEGRFVEALTMLAHLKEPVDRFFNEVLVMADDEHVRRNRLSMLNELQHMMERSADISKLAV